MPGGNNVKGHFYYRKSSMYNYTEAQSGMKELWSGQAASEGLQEMHLERQLRTAEGPCVFAKQSEIDPEGNGGASSTDFKPHDDTQGLVF